MIELKNVTKIYKTKGGSVRALDGVSLLLPEKGMVFILGKSGCGKSTMLNILGGLDKPTAGEIIVKGRSSTSFSSSDFDSYRNTFVGFIFQEYNVLPEFSVKQNVILAPELQGNKERIQAVGEVLSSVELSGLEDRKPNTLSGGQKQRIAIARALIKNPEIILADEPTGALDSATGKAVLDTLKKLSENKLVVVVSHDREFAERYADRIVELHDGKILSDRSVSAEEIALNDKVTVMPDGIHLIGEADEELLAKLNELLKTKKTVTVTLEEENACISAGHFIETNTEKLPRKTYTRAENRFIRSKFPLKYAIRMGASGMKSKPFRLVMTILLTMIALSAFGFSLSLMTYDSEKVLENGLLNSKYTEFSFGQYRVVEDDYGYKYGEPVPVFYDKTQEFYQNAFPFLPVRNYSADLSVQFENSSENFYYPDAFTGFTPADEKLLRDVGCPLLYGSMPQQAEEVAISRLMAEGFLKYGDFAVSKIEDLLGKTVSFAKLELKITGVFDCPSPHEQYSFLKDVKDLSEIQNDSEKFRLYYGLKGVYESSFSAVAVVSEEFHQKYGTELSLQNDSSYPIDIETSDMSSDMSSYTTYLPLCISGNSPDDGLFFDASKTFLKEGEFMLPSEELVAIYDSFCYSNGMDPYSPNAPFNHDILYNNKYYTLEEIRSEFLKLLSHLEKYGWNFSDVQLRMRDNILENMKCVGVSYNQFALILVREDYSNLLGSYNKQMTENQYDFFLCSKTDECCALFAGQNIDDADESNLYFALYNNVFTDKVETYSAIIDICSDVFFWMGIVLAIFASLLLFNFISVSISYKKKEIGILRALGARKIDVFKIFFSESMLIVGICFLLSATLSAILVNAFDAFLISRIHISCALFFYGPLQALAILLLSVLVAFISTILPVYHSAKKPPVDAIRAL